MDTLHYALVAVIIALVVILAIVSAMVLRSNNGTPIISAFASFLGLFRPNILLLSTYVAVIILLLVVALTGLINGDQEADNDFLKGALIGLIGTGITALTSLGNNILEKDASGSSQTKAKQSSSE